MRYVSHDMFKRATQYIEDAVNFLRIETDIEGNQTWWVLSETTNKKVAELLVDDGWSYMEEYRVHEKVYAAVAHTIDV